MRWLLGPAKLLDPCAPWHRDAGRAEACIHATRLIGLPLGQNVLQLWCYVKQDMPCLGAALQCACALTACLAARMLSPPPPDAYKSPPLVTQHRMDAND